MVYPPFKYLIFAIVLIFALPVFGNKAEKGDVSVGIEGKVVVSLSKADVKPIPIEQQTALILRLGNIRKNGNSYEYELYYIGMIPGRHDLKAYLVNKNDTPLLNCEPIYVDVKRKLPKKHNGMLTKVNPSPVDGVIWYSPLMGAVVLIWLFMLIPLIFYKRKKKQVIAPPVHFPTIAERLQPLVIKASEGDLSLEEKAHLEDLIMLYWCKELDLDMKDIVGSLMKLKEHDKAGRLLNAVESWLHKPPGREQIDIHHILAQYRKTI